MANEAQVSFAPGLFEVMTSTNPPDISFFKTLPTDVEGRWGIYVITLERPNHKPRIYIGSRTHPENVVLKTGFISMTLSTSCPFTSLELSKKVMKLPSKGCWTPMANLLHGFY